MLEAIIPAVGALAGSLIQGEVNKSVADHNAKQTYKYNKQLLELQDQMNMRNWNTQAAYNSVGAQLARLKAAGLNTNLVYGAGADGGIASAAPEVGNAPMEYNMQSPNLAGGINSAVSLYQAAAEKENIEARTNLTKQQTLTEMYKAAIAAKDAKFAEAIKSAQLELLGAQAEEAKTSAAVNTANVSKINADRGLTEIIAYYYPLLADNTLSLGEQTRKESRSRINLNSKQMEEINARINVHKATADKLKAEIVKISYEIGKLYTSSLLDGAQVQGIAQGIKESQARIRKLGAEAGLTELEVDNYVFNTMKQGRVSMSLSDKGFSFDVPVWVPNLFDAIGDVVTYPFNGLK